MIYLIISTSFLILLSAFFSGAETAITAASQAKMHQMKLQGNKKAKLVLELRENKEKLIGTILLANNGLNILSSSIVAANFMTIFGEEGVIYASFIMTIIILIFAEVLPKSYAFDNPEKVSLKIVYIIDFLVKAFSPITSTIRWISIKALKLFNLNSKSAVISGNEALRGTIELFHHEGQVIKTDKDMLGAILDLRDVTVEQIMLHRSNFFSLDVNLPIRDIINKCVETNYTRIPFWEGNPDNIIGIMHVKNLFRKALRENMDETKINIKELLIEAWFVPNTTNLSDQLHQFQKRKNHFAFVVDEYGILMGLITLEDILEEIVGQIDDEHDTEKDNIKKLDDKKYIVNGQCNIRDINRELDIDLPEDDANTIAGLIMYEVQKIPEEGEVFVIENTECKVLKKNNNKITFVEITKLERDDDDI